MVAESQIISVACVQFWVSSAFPFHKALFLNSSYMYYYVLYCINIFISIPPVSFFYFSFLLYDRSVFIRLPLPTSLTYPLYVKTPQINTDRKV
jgi:hypothetical protein